MKLSGFGSTSNVRYFWFCSPVGLVGNAAALSTFPQWRRRAELSGALDWDVLEPAVLVVAADASWPVKDGVGAVRVDVDLDPRLDEMGSHRTFGDLQLKTSP